MREVVLRPRAQLDLESIFIHISMSLGMPQAAQETIEALYDAFESIANIPTLGMAFENDELERAYRRILKKNYWIYYTYDEEKVTIWRIFHTRQDISSYTLVDF